MTDQAEGLRQLVKKTELPSNKARVVAITSGKGGVGKTMLCANLAIAISHLNKKVLIIDADFGLANVDVVLNISSKYTLQHVIEGKISITGCLVEGPAGVKLIPGASGIPKLANLSNRQRKALIESFSTLETKVDFILIDTSAGISRNVINIALAADETIVVTTPDPTAITDAYAVVKVVAAKDNSASIKLLVNMVSSKEEADRVSERISFVSKQFLNVFLENAGFIFADPIVARATRERVPFLLTYPHSRVSKCVRLLAKNLCNNQDPNKKTDTGKVGFLHKLATIFK